MVVDERYEVPGLAQQLLDEHEGRHTLVVPCSGSEEGSYLRLIDFCITQL